MANPIAIPESSDPRDFPDWLNPIVVKELRQGLRQFHFPLGFLLAHGILVAAFVMAFDSLRTGGEINPGAGSAISSSIFASFAFFGFFIQPLRALFSISEESSSASIEFLLLSRLGPLEIFTGKWLALFSQTVLLALSLLPYLVLRYHLGGMRLFGELSTLYWMLMASGILTAVAVTASVCKSKWSRFTLPLFWVFFLPTVSGFCATSPELAAVLAGDPTAPGYLPAFLAMNLIGISTIRLVLHAGAAQIAPAIEMRSERIRLFGLAALLGILLSPGWAMDSRLLAAALFAFVLLFATFVEPPVKLVSAPSNRIDGGGGWRGRFARIFLFPGWPHGSRYAILVLIPIFTATTLLCRGVVSTSTSHAIPMVGGAAILPLLPFLPATMVGMLDLGDKDVLSRFCNPFLLGVCFIPVTIIGLVMGTAREHIYIPMGFLYFIACLIFGLMGWEHRHQLALSRAQFAKAATRPMP